MAPTLGWNCNWGAVPARKAHGLQFPHGAGREAAEAVPKTPSRTGGGPGAGAPGLIHPDGDPREVSANAGRHHLYVIKCNAAPQQLVSKENPKNCATFHQLLWHGLERLPPRTISKL